MQHTLASERRDTAIDQQLRTGLVTFLLTVVCFAAAHAQQTNNDDATRIMSLETIWNEAELQQDTKAVDHLLADKFVYVDIDGSQQTKPEFLESIKNRLEHIDAIGFDAAATNVTVYGNSAVVTGTYRERGSLHGKPYSRRGRFTDTWIKQGSAWVCVASQATMIEK